MSNEQRQQREQVQAAAAEQPDDKWGDPISEARQQELQVLLDAWNAPGAEHGKRRGPFDGRELTGADLSWLAEQVRGKSGSESNLPLQGANLSFAQLQGANLSFARLQGATLYRAQLQEATLREARLQGANLSGARLDGKTTLADAILFEPKDTRSLLVRLLRRPRYGPALVDLHWGDFDQVQLTQLQGWDDLPRLADERGLNWRRRAVYHRAAVRAYRQVAQRIRDQGFSDIADHLTAHAHVLQRKLLFRLMLEDWRRPWHLPSDLTRWLFSWFLAVLAGYGYHPGRSVFWYLVTIAGFAFAFYQLGSSEHVPFSQLGAVVFSVTSFHGRGFFPGGSPGHSLTLDDPVTVLAAGEAIIGLLIEISFIATFTQRFFGAK